MGDPFGNGPEIILKALHKKSVYGFCCPLVIGDVSVLSHAVRVAEQVSGFSLNLHAVNDPSEACYEHGMVDVIDLGIVHAAEIPCSSDNGPFGLGPTKLGGEASFRCVKKAIELALAGKIDATVTNALSKEAIHMAGHNYSGHTEIFADLTSTSNYRMMLALDSLRVVHVSTHVSLLNAINLVKRDRVLETIRLADSSCRALGMKRPRIAVCGLNPHCGENGLFGSEEREEIQPAIDAAVAEGILIPDRRPVAADTVFSKAVGGWYDIVVAMYHDQGHIPLKVKGFVYNREEKTWSDVSGVNVTLGLPIIRTSVDHGTGFGHAGNGQANEQSLINAMEYAARLAAGR